MRVCSAKRCSILYTKFMRLSSNLFGVRLCVVARFFKIYCHPEERSDEGSRVQRHRCLFTGFFTAARFRMTAGMADGPGFCPGPSAYQKSPGRTFLTASTAERFESFKTLLRPKSLKFQAFLRRVIVMRELRFAAACGRRKRCAISAAAPSVGRREAGPQTAVRQGEQGVFSR